MRKRIRSLLLLGLTALVLTAAAVPSWAADVYLVAKELTKTMPDGAQVVMWGFALDADGDLATDGGEAAVVPGPMITVGPGDSTLNIHLRNDLEVPVSMVIPGLYSALSPVRFTDPEGRQRVQSFTAETAPGAQRTYSWQARPGSHIYHSGTHPFVQVQMGLYGGVKQEHSAGRAYASPDTAYQHEVSLFYSEIDPALHEAVASGSYGTPDYPGPISYRPSYFLVNGQPYSASQPPIYAGAPGEKTLVRFFNAGNLTHAPVLQGMYLSLVAEGGNPYPHARQQYSVMLPAGGTVDALLSPTAGGEHPVYDRMLSLLNAGASPGGHFSVLSFSAGGVLAASDDSYSTDEDAALNVAAPGVLGNDTLSGGSPAAELVTGAASGSVSLSPDGSFSYTPSQDYNGADSFEYRITSGGLTSNTATVSLVVNPVNDAPVANGDSATTTVSTAVAIAVLANDTDADNDALSVANLTAPASGTATLNLDKSVTYTPNAGFTGTDSFTYTAFDGAAHSAAATVTVTVKAANSAPFAAYDYYDTPYYTPITMDVLANDTDSDGDSLSVVITQAPTGGSVAVNPDKTVTYSPDPGFSGTDRFYYKASDGIATSNTARVVVRVAANQLPVAVVDSAVTMVNTTVVIDLAANDYDPDGSVVPGSVAVLTSPGRGGSVVNNSDGTVTFTPKADFKGYDYFYYNIKDNHGATSRSAKVTVKVEK